MIWQSQIRYLKILHLHDDGNDGGDHGHGDGIRSWDRRTLRRHGDDGDAHVRPHRHRRDGDGDVRVRRHHRRRDDGDDARVRRHHRHRDDGDGTRSRDRHIHRHVYEPIPSSSLREVLLQDSFLIHKYLKSALRLTDPREL